MEAEGDDYVNWLEKSDQTKKPKAATLYTEVAGVEGVLLAPGPPTGANLDLGCFFNARTISQLMRSKVS